MNYIGKFITNFREFYNEINSATLTGAIDVVIIQQPDGTYQCSPFHVRFGKIGVLRSREKVVDIEINGNPIGIQMKLGESGEAFFVEGVPEDHEELIPNYLATSPLPPVTDIGAELQKMKLEVAFEMNCETLKGTEELVESEMTKCVVVQSGDKHIFANTSLGQITDFVPIQIGDHDDLDEDDDAEHKVDDVSSVSLNQNVVFHLRNEVEVETLPEVVSSIVVSPEEKINTELEPKTMVNFEQDKPDDEIVVANSNSSISDSPRLSSVENATVQTPQKQDIVLEIEESRHRSAVVSCSTPRRNDVILENPCSSAENKVESEKEEEEESNLQDESKVKRKRRKKSMIKRRPRNREVEVQTSADRERSDSRDSGSTDQDRPPQPLPSLPPLSSVGGAGGVSSGVLGVQCERRRGDSDEIFRMDEDDDHFENYPHLLRPSAIALSRSISLPLSASLPTNRSMHYGWRSRKLASTFAGEFHPFSDTDVTPLTSPRGSRPPSPKSDSEFERIKNDATCQTDHGEISWVWGELPNVPKNNSVQDWRQASANIEQNGQLVSFEGEETKNEGGVDKNPTMLGGVLNFMRTTKKMRHMPESEGIFLDDLNPDELDPEVAALYFPKYRSQYSRPMYNKELLKDEDTESGNGPSLPHSPHSVEGAIGGPSCLDSDSDERHSVFDFCSKHYTDLELSLCGGLQDYEGDIPHERFLHFVVTYDDLCENPSLLQDQNLVIRMGGKYYNWQTAGPMLLSLALFQRPLTEKAVGQLVTDFMPKKKKKSYSWWSWRRPAPDSDMKTNNSTDLLSDQEQGGKSESTTPPHLIPGMRSENRDIVGSLIETSVMERVLHVEERIGNTGGLVDSDSELVELQNRRPEMFKKSLTLSSEQITSLQLKEGANEVVFSVTTAFQGTTRCKCYIYLWKYDDKIVISDIDGTITKSDVLGHILPIIGQDWAQSGVAQLFTKIKSNGYQFLYLSARAIGQARVTKDYLRSVRQGDLCLPDGPLLLSPTSLISAFHREVIEKKPEVFKINCLSNIQALFPKEIVGNPFYAGFGNKINDTWAYRAVEIPLTRIFTINHRGELKLELIQTFQSSYTRLSDVVDHVFPPLKRDKAASAPLTTNFVVPEHYSSFTYWRLPLPTVTPSSSYQEANALTASASGSAAAAPGSAGPSSGAAAITSPVSPKR